MPILPKWMRALYAKATGTTVWEETDKGKAVLEGYHAADPKDEEVFPPEEYEAAPKF